MTFRLCPGPQTPLQSLPVTPVLFFQLEFLCLAHPSCSHSLGWDGFETREEGAEISQLILRKSHLHFSIHGFPLLISTFPLFFFLLKEHRSLVLEGPILAQEILKKMQDQQILWMAKLRFPLLLSPEIYIKQEGKFTPISHKELPSRSCSLPPKKRCFPLKAQQSAAVKPPSLPPAPKRGFSGESERGVVSSLQ